MNVMDNIMYVLKLVYEEVYDMAIWHIIRLIIMMQIFKKAKSAY